MMACQQRFECSQAAQIRRVPPQAARRLLVVDDEPEIADLMCSWLACAGCDVSIAKTGAVALQMLLDVRFDAVVSPACTHVLATRP